MVTTYKMSPLSFLSMVLCLMVCLYFPPPFLLGLDDDNKPFICAMDLLGCPVSTNDFVVSGTCSANLYGVCESLFQPGS